MTRDEFIQAKTFIFLDIEREIQLAKADAAVLQAQGVAPGGGNFLAALGLLCYTEFGGKLRLNVRRKGKDVASANFNQFFDLLGVPYRVFLSQHKVYDVFRCGLAHEYYIKKNCTIAMVEETPGAGLRVDASGRYSVVVESYCRDLKKAFNDLQIHLYGS